MERVKIQQMCDNLGIPIYVRGDLVVQNIPSHDVVGWEKLIPDPRALPSGNHGGERLAAAAELAKT